MRQFENLGRTLRLERAAWVHGDRCCAVLHTLGEHLGVVLLVLARQQGAEILDAFAVRRICWLKGCPPQIAGRGELNAIRRESIPDERCTHTFSCFVVFEYGENDCAHVSLLGWYAERLINGESL